MSASALIVVSCLILPTGGFLPTAQGAESEAGKAKEGEVSLETQLISKEPGGSYLASETEAIFFPPLFKHENWGANPMWEKKPEPKQKLPDTWKTKVGFDVAYGRSRAILRAPEGTDFYGTGEVMGKLRRNNTKVALWNTDNYAYGTDEGRRLYQSHPWVLGVRPDGTAFGMLADTTWRALLEITDKEVIVDSEGPVFPVIVIEGKDPEDVMKQLAERIGTIKLPPLWALGYQQSRWSYETPEKGLTVARSFREKKIPADVIWMDIDYMDGFRVFTFNPKTFADPKSYSDALHDLNFKGVWMIDPGVKVDENYAVFKSGNENDVWVKKGNQQDDFVGPVWPGDCKFPDFTREETRQWWAGLYDEFMNKNGLDGIWNDMNEPAVFQSPGHTMPVDNHHRGDGTLPPGPHVKYHNIYGMLMLKASSDGMLAAQPDKRPFLLSRANFLGGHRYGATWTGDNVSSERDEHLSIPMCLNIGLSGQPFIGPDLGGFGNNLDPKLWKEWVSFGVFFPFCRAHAAKGTNDKEPWAFGKELEDHARTAIERRYRLLPYIYTLFEESSRNGMPVMRPTFFAAPSDLALRDEETSFLLGKDVLVIAPFAENPDLPKAVGEGESKADWLPLTLLNENADADPAQAQLKLRPGAILPVGQLVQHTGEPMLTTTTLVINLDDKGTATGTLYEDGGNGFEYAKGDYARTSYTATTQDGNVTVTAQVTDGERKPSTERLVIRILTPKGEIRGEGTPDKPIIIPLP